MSQKINKESLFAVLFLMLTFSTFFLRGMYFEGEQFLYLALLGLLGIFVFFFIPAKEGCKEMDWFVLSIVVAYAISMVSAIYFRNAFVEVLKFSSCLLVYFMAKRLLVNRKVWLLSTLYLGGVLMSLIGLGAASGAYYISGSYEHEKNLVMSLFQYHNTSAMMLSCVFLFGLSLYTKATKRWMRLLLCAGNMIALLTVVFSQSRGVWLLFPVLLFLYSWILPKGEKFRYLPVLGTILSALIVLKGLGNAFAEQNTVLCIVYMAASVLMAVLFGILLDLALPKVKMSKKTGLIIGAVLLLLILLFVIFGRQLLPQSILTRITEFNLTSKTVTERLTFYQDAFTVFKKYPLLGIGGGGWPFIYQEYQSYFYQANSPHSFLLHLMVEAGVLGILVFLLLVYLMIRSFVKLLKSSKEVRMEQAPFFASVAIIFVHSMFDIDFSFFTMTTITWMLLAVVSSMEQPSANKKNWIRFVAIACSLLIAVCGVCGKIAWDQYYKTATYLQTDAKKALQCATKAVTYDPGNSMYALTKGNVAFHLAAASMEKEPDDMYEYADQAKTAFERGYQSNPRDHMLIYEAATFYVNIGEFNKGCQLIDQLMTVRPLSPDSYKEIATIYTAVAQAYQQNDDLTSVKKMMTRVVQIREDSVRIAGAKGQKVRLTIATKQAIAQAETILKQIEQKEEKQ